MPHITLGPVGRGIIQDLPSRLLPPEIWSNGKNVRFQDKKLLRMLGHTEVFATPSVAPHWALGVPDGSNYFWLYAGLAKVFTVQGGTHSGLTRASGDYTGAASNKWNGGILNGIPVITNGVDDPQSWSPIATGTPLVDLPNWPASTTCKVIKPFKNFLIALNITKSGTNFPHRIKWSHSADPGSIPNSWDETDATKDAGERELSDIEAGVLVDAVLLGDRLAIYKERSTWFLQHIGGRFIFRTKQEFNTTGILAQGCASALANGKQHFVATGDDLIVHNGVQIESVIAEKWKKFLNTNMDIDNFAASFTVINPSQDEAWFCFPESGATFPTLALVVNILTGHVGVRELSNAAYIAAGIVQETTDESWDADTEAWADDTTTWGDRLFNPQLLGLLQCDPTNTKFYHMDKTNQFDGSNFESFAERDGLTVIGVDREGNPISELNSNKLVTRLWIEATGDPFEARVGAQKKVGGPLTWLQAQTFTPGVDQYLDFLISGNLLAVRFQSSTNTNFEIERYALDVEKLGEF